MRTSSNQLSESVKYYVVTGKLQSMVHREGCAMLKRATHAKQRSRNPIIGDKFGHYRSHSCLSIEARNPGTNEFWQSQKAAVPRKALELPEYIYFHVPGPLPAKPRQTQKDKWLKRPCVMRARAWTDRARLEMKKASGVAMLDTARTIHVKVYLPMPKSWSRKKAHEMRGTPHRAKPDNDNMLKQVCDSLVRKDETIYRKEIYKEWAIEGSERTEIYITT